MKGRPVDQLVYETMFPKPRQQDPHNFQALLQRHLVLEVRQEVHSFYGHLDTPEAKYPGLDYTHPVHRIRLSRWPWHRRLFRAFDSLRLTHAEISGLTKWEGTKWAKERFEREQGIVIHDTTADGFADYVEPEDRETPERQQEESHEPEEARSGVADAGTAEDSDGELESIGVALNERLRERVALRNLSGDMTVPIDEEWENWFKNVLESGNVDSRLPTGRATALIPERIFPRDMLAAARAGQWDQIPVHMRTLMRTTLDEPESLDLNTVARRLQYGLLDPPAGAPSRPAERFTIPDAYLTPERLEIDRLVDAARQQAMRERLERDREGTVGPQA